MTINLNTAEAAWNAEFPGGDFLAGVMKTDTGYELKYRFRYHMDEKVWDSKDVKNWYTFHLKPGHGLDEAIAEFTKAISILPWVGEIQFLDFRGKTDDEKMDILVQQKWAHRKHFSADGKELKDH